MQTLIQSAKAVLAEHSSLPFSIYSSVKEQRIVNVPIIKPLLVFVLDGCKELGENSDIHCPAGRFVFLSNSSKVNMRNIPGGTEYFALLIEFDYEDFDGLAHQTAKTQSYIQGEIDPLMHHTLQQFIEWATFAPSHLWALRRQEILQLLYHQGHQQICAIAEPPSLSHRLHNMITRHIAEDLGAEELSLQLAMSESTLRRKLQAEGTSFQSIKDRARLGYGLHLVQTQLDPIGRIAEQCGYSSQSRFTDKFRQLFGMTPSELRKTRLLD